MKTNILIPMASKSSYFPDVTFPYPKPLIEIGGKTMIERVIENLSSVSEEVQFTFVVSKNDCDDFHLDDTINIISENSCNIVRLDKEAKGAACSCLMAIEYINNTEPLLIANYDQLFDVCLKELLSGFVDTDVGVVTFDSVHPRWSYVRLDDKGFVIESAEKRPISRNAIAGLYYYREGRIFISAVKKMISKDCHVNGSFYISPAINESILTGESVRSVSIDSSNYHTFYTPQKVGDYLSNAAKRLD